MFGKDDAGNQQFTGEPPRLSLTEPPPGYQTPSPDQPYGVGKAKPEAKTSKDYYMDHRGESRLSRPHGARFDQRVVDREPIGRRPLAARLRFHVIAARLDDADR